MIERRCAVVPAALLLDRVFGDPPNRYHPVAWMGRAISWAWRHRPSGGSGRLLVYGAAVVGSGLAGSIGVGWLLERWLRRLPPPVSWLVEAGMLSTLVAGRGLGQAAASIAVALREERVSEAAQLASWHLVSRDTTRLSASQLAAATIESVAENTSDGVIAPLVFYTVAGVPGALAYRWINTCDSMWGYRDAGREWIGKVPARLDDLVNLLPARMTAALLVVAAWLRREDVPGAFAVWRRDAGNTASPNAGRPMSVAAGALGVELEKVGHYRLGTGGRSPNAQDVIRSISLMRVAVSVAAGVPAAIYLLARIGRGRCT